MFTFILASHLDSAKRGSLLKIMIDSIDKTVTKAQLSNIPVLIHLTADTEEWISTLQLAGYSAIAVNITTAKDRMSQFQKIAKLLPLTKSRYVIFVDDDDILFPSFLPTFISKVKLVNSDDKVFGQVAYTQDPFNSYYGTDYNRGKVVKEPEFCGSLCSVELVNDFLNDRSDIICCGTADGKFIWHCIENADTHFIIKEPQYHYRTWDNPRTWRKS